MPNFPTEEKQLISSIFSDETPLFRTPAEPEVGDTVSIRLRIIKNADAQPRFQYAADQNGRRVRLV